MIENALKKGQHNILKTCLTFSWIKN